MATQFISLFVAALAAALAPLIARLIPNGLVPETVILLVAGAALGPYALGAIQLDESITMISELGLAFLFLLAGYEINPRTLKSRQGKRGLVTWIATFGIATLVILLSHTFSITHFDGIAVAIALTTTALGMLIPIMKERNLDGTETGEAMLAYGTWGEVCPIIAMALLLSSRSEWRTLLILLAFMALCVVLAVIPARSRKVGSRVYRFLASKRHTTSQTFVRAVVVLLIGLVTLSAVFGLDIVLGSFAAGFVLRFVIPEGSEELEAKLNAIGHGFLIPIFFVVSGAKINLTSIGDQPLLLAVFIVALLLVRAVPIVVAMSVGRGKSPLSPHNRITVALYCTTALPLIVAVTSVATNAGALSQSTASVLVAAGAISVFLMPLLASLTYRVVDSNAPEGGGAKAANETGELLSGREEDR